MKALFFGDSRLETARGDWPRSQLLLFLLGFLLHAVPPGNYLPDLSWARCISSAITSVSKMHCSRYCGHYTPVSRKIIGACREPIRGAHDLSFLDYCLLTTGYCLLTTDARSHRDRSFQKSVSRHR